MFQKILNSELFRVVCALLVSLILQSCYSNFVINEPITQDVLRQKEITKLILADSSEIVFDESRKMEFSKPESILIKSQDGTKKMIDLSSIKEAYEHKYDSERTTNFLTAVGGIVVIGTLFIISLAKINYQATHGE